MLIKVNYYDYDYKIGNRCVTSYMSDYIPRVNESLYFDTIGYRQVTDVEYHIENNKLSYVEINTMGIKGKDINNG